jgi:ATP-dependent phosphoenolpyruvate carboxykinase
MGIQNKNILYNPTVSEMYEIAFLLEKPSDIHTKHTKVSNDGALCADSGLNKSRNQLQERIVKDAETEKTVQW